MVRSRVILRRMRNFSDKICRGNQNTHFVYNNFFHKNRPVLRDNVGKYSSAGQATDDNIIWRMRIACWVTTATDTHSEYLILVAFPWQQWLGERASVLSLYFHSLSCQTAHFKLRYTRSGNKHSLYLICSYFSLTAILIYCF